MGTVTDPPEHSVRWLMQLLWKQGDYSPDFIRKWTTLETESENLGDELKEYSARWIWHQVRDRVVAQRDYVILAREWIALEVRLGNLGNFENPAIGSARWICRACFDNGFRMPSLLDAWIQVEKGVSMPIEAAGPDRYTLRWILRQDWKQKDLDRSLCLRLKTEIEASNFGDPASPEKHSAREIARAAWATQLANRGSRPDLAPSPKASNLSSDFILLWVKAEAAGRAEEGGEPAEFSPRWIFRQAWEAEISLLQPWLEAESHPAVQQTSEGKYSAEWIRAEIDRRAAAMEQTLARMPAQPQFRLGIRTLILGLGEKKDYDDSDDPGEAKAPPADAAEKQDGDDAADQEK